MKVPMHVPKTPKWLDEFQAFIQRGSVVDLAVGIIIGAAFTGIVTSLVKDLLTPLLGLVIGGIDFSDLFVTLKGSHEPTLDAAKHAGAVTLNIGLFLNAVINFLIISFAIFWLVKGISKLHKKPDEAPAGPSPSEMLLTEIRDLLAQKKEGQGSAPWPEGRDPVKAEP